MSDFAPMCWYEGTDFKWKMIIEECGSVWENDDPKQLADKVRSDLERYNPDLFGNSEVIEVLNALILEGG